MTAWATLLFYAGSVILGIATNFAIAAYYAGKYKERVERLTAEVNRYEEKVDEQGRKLEKFGRQLAAYTGQANGGT